MKKSLKAALLSAFVLPGAGHFFLKKYPMGITFAALAIAGIFSIVATTLERAQAIADKILSGEVPSDISAISTLASQSLGSDAQQLNIATTTLLISWIVGIIDAYRLGRIEDNVK